ncbi:ABC transporter ATP-binding protein [Rhodovulum steppense]|uniref:Peptide/nickel transport system ATP-binding protein n=1 Tax=Rhodovulum steppense TaxID=540251 RepID=A0A4V2R3H7_9RHOB|nr:ATP-binding cassette domain-containing protein [Rhodovulum steppense]TCM76570.1 peptide/nickel transport system ATP-binding protein [Rhodovulum steppense]
MTLLSATDITVRDGAARLVAPVSLELHPGEPLVILGETGSGKSLLAQAIMGTLPASLRATGTVRIGGCTLLAEDRAAFRGLWGRQIAVLPQEPWLSLDPLMRAGPQVAEAHRLVAGLPAAAARNRAAEELAALGLDTAAARYPHELSGGMAQRVAIAAARAGGASLVIADEPTKGLDAARRDDVAALLLAALTRSGGLLVITHDLALARRIGGRLMVLRDGAVVETGATSAVLSAPQAAYTRDLIAADPESWSRRVAPSEAGQAVLEARNLTLSRGGQRLVDGLTLELRAGRILGITGPSGCGKSSLGDALLGLLTPERGHITRARGLAPTAFQKLWQDPVAAFPRTRRLGQTLRDVARLHAAPPERIGGLLERLRLDSALLSRRPAAVSGGELQRLALLRAMLANPRFIFADEPTSRLDPITQREVIGLLADLARTDGLAIALVSHDPVLIDRVCDETCSLPMKRGEHDTLECSDLLRTAIG